MPVSMTTHRSELGLSSGKHGALKGQLTLFHGVVILGHTTHFTCFMNILKNENQIKIIYIYIISILLYLFKYNLLRK